MAVAGMADGPQAKHKEGPAGGPPAADPARDLVISRVIDAPAILVWRAWTRPEHIVRWFTPPPWTTPECRIDLRPGGHFCTVMRGPDGAEHASCGVYLEVEAPRRLVFTDALEPGWRPAASPFFTAILTFEALAEGGTRYTARLLHKDAADREKHEAMGFHEGWGIATDQLAALVAALKAAG